MTVNEWLASAVEDAHRVPQVKCRRRLDGFRDGRADGRDHGPVLVVHQGHDVLLVLALGQKLRVARPFRDEHLPAHVHEALDVRIRGALVLRLDVEHHFAVSDVGVVAGDHARVGKGEFSRYCTVQARGF